MRNLQSKPGIRMKPILLSLLILATAPALLFAQSADEEKKALTELLYEFLEGASYGDAATHDRFWSEELIYTGSAGNRITKADIMSGATENPDRSAEPEMRYDAEEIQINLYGETAVVAFKLVGISGDERIEFYNTGTFRNEAGQWRAVAWQATRIPE
jgi:hypothetical protein